MTLAERRLDAAFRLNSKTVQDRIVHVVRVSPSRFVVHGALFGGCRFSLA